MPSNVNFSPEEKNFIDWQLAQRPDPFTTPGNYSTFADFYKAQGIDPYGADMQKFAQESLARWNPIGDVRQNAYGNSGNEWENPNWAELDAARRAAQEAERIRVANTPSPFSIGPGPAPTTNTSSGGARTASATNTGSAQTANQYTTDYDKIVRDAYAQIGRTGLGANANQIDQGGYDYWMGQLKSGMSPDDFAKTFGNTVNYLTSTPIEDIKKNSAANNQPNEAVIKYVDQYLNDNPVTIKTDTWKATTGGGQGMTANPVSQLAAAKALTGSGGGASMGSDVATVGANSAQNLTAGTAPYRSALIQSLRNSTGGDISNNPGVVLSRPNTNLGNIDFRPPSGGVNNPGVLRPGGGTPAPLTPTNPTNPTNPTTPTPGRGTVGTPSDMPAAWNGYWDTKPVGSVINWAGGTLNKIGANTAIYIGPDGEQSYLMRDSDFNELALRFPAIAKQWLTEFGFVPQPRYESGGGA